MAMEFDFSEVLGRMVEANASDVHLTPGFPPAMRDRGKIVPMDGFPELTSQDTREVVFSILNDDQRKRFENNHQLDFAYAIPGVARFRVNCFFQRGAVSAAFRLVPQNIPSLDSLKVPEVLRDLSAKPRGFVLVTGPTGSGKSTTLAAMIDVINSGNQDHILTIEDPIEFLHQHKRSIVNQREVGSDATDFALGLRAALREDPDVILVGEMRDLETISTALTAAETGHLVFATLHTQSTAQTVDRIIDVFPPEQQGQVRTQLSIALQGIVTQQLLPTADGRGRVVACEVLVPTPAIRNLIREGKTHQIYAAVQTSGAVGMQTMDADLARLVRMGTITRSLAEQRASVPEELKRLLGGAPVETASMPGNGVAQAPVAHAPSPPSPPPAAPPSAGPPASAPPPTSVPPAAPAPSPSPPTSAPPPAPSPAPTPGSASPAPPPAPPAQTPGA
jgi:twitching motility protein PilT